MPTLQDHLEFAITDPVQVRLQPVRILLQSLMLINKADEFLGLGDWVYRTVQRMSAEDRQANQLVLTGFHYAVLPQQDFPNFPAYLDNLAHTDPQVLIDRMLDFYASMPADYVAPGESIIDRKTAMLSADNYLASLQQRFRPDHIDETIERLAYRYLQDPPAMQRLIVGHLQMMWDRYLDDEWQRIHPILESTARAYARLNLNGLTFQEAARSITGQDMQDMEKWDWCLAEAKRSIFIPHPHVGPYLFRSVRAGTLYVFFSPRRPEGSQDDAPDLSRAEIVVRLNALADDTRLHILKHIADHGELRSHEIMSMLDLSQSAASRHLSQLSAGGYLKERRCEGAKCYELNTERLNGTLQAVSSFLLGKRKG